MAGRTCLADTFPCLLQLHASLLHLFAEYPAWGYIRNNDLILNSLNLVDYRSEPISACDTTAWLLLLRVVAPKHEYLDKVFRRAPRLVAEILGHLVVLLRDELLSHVVNIASTETW